jgi:hypothetical protein
MPTLTHPEIVREAHRQYLAAGAEVLIANTYATSPLLFNHLGRDSDVAVIDAAAVRFGTRGAEASDRAVPVAGSFSVMRPGIPGSDRSEMLRQWPEPEARRLFEAKAAGLVAAGVDVIAMEMMRDGDYSVWATEAAAATGSAGVDRHRRRGDEDDTGRLIGFGRPNWPLEEFVEPLLRAAPSAMVSVMHTAPHLTGAGSRGRAPSLARLVGRLRRVGILRHARLAVRRHHSGCRLRRARSAMDRVVRSGDDRRLLWHRAGAHRRARGGVQVTAAIPAPE